MLTRVHSREKPSFPLSFIAEVLSLLQLTWARLRPQAVRRRGKRSRKSAIDPFPPPPFPSLIFGPVDGFQMCDHPRPTAQTFLLCCKHGAQMYSRSQANLLLLSFSFPLFFPGVLAATGNHSGTTHYSSSTVSLFIVRREDLASCPRCEWLQFQTTDGCSLMSPGRDASAMYRC